MAESNTMKHQILAITFLALLLSGCGNDDATEEPQAAAFDGMLVQLRVPEGSDLSSFLESDVLDWSGRSGADVEFVEDSKLQDVQPGDLLVVRLSDVVELEGQLAVVPDGYPGLDELQWNTTLRGLRDRVAKRGSVPMVMPFSSPTLVCYYRKDLLDKASLEPPKTWNDYHTLIGMIDEWAPGLKVAEPLGPEARVAGFAARAMAYSHPEGSLSLFFDLTSGKPLVSSPGFVRAVEELKSAAPSLEDSWTLSIADCRRELLEGRAAIGFAFEPVLGADNEVQRGDGVELAFCPVPGSTKVYNRSLDEWKETDLNQPGLVGIDGLVACVVKGDTTAELAGFSLLTAVADRIMKSLDTPVRGVTAEWQVDAASDLFKPLTETEARSYVGATVKLSRSTNLVRHLPIPNGDAFSKVLAEVLSPESLAQKSANEIVSDLGKRWSELIEKHGKDAFVKSFRWNSGLKP